MSRWTTVQAALRPLMITIQRAKCLQIQKNHRLFSNATKTTTVVTDGPKLDTLINLCKHKGYVFPSSEIYGSVAGFFDYGPLGVELRNNIKRLWWRDMVQRREDVVGLDSSIISSPAVWRASGHVEGFSDPMVDCRKTQTRYRADQVFWAAVHRQKQPGEVHSNNNDDSINHQLQAPVCYVCVVESETMLKDATAAAAKRAKALGAKGPFQPLHLQDLTTAQLDIYHLIPSPATGEPGDLTPPRDFNLMFQTSVGAVQEEAAVAYLRPETAQGIFTNFANVQRTSRAKIPFGIAQVGKAFRNEITPRHFVFRSREFEQMEIEYFIPPEDDVWQQHHEAWIDTCWSWLLGLGIKEELLSKVVHPPHKLAHYARACTDIAFQYPFGAQELMGVAARGCFDLTQHAQHSGKALEYTDPVSGRKYLPHVIEPSIGVDRLFLALLTSAYREETVAGEKRVVLGLHPALAPIKAAVLPLVGNKPEIVALARTVYAKLQRRHMVEFDTSGAVGRRYRRADEAGTPYCITVDYESLDDGCVTVRDRDSMAQQRVPISDIANYISERMDGGNA